MNKQTSLLLISLVGVLSGCRENATTGSAEVWDLISNSSFEVSGIASIEGWTYWSNVDSMVEFSNDTPPGGGNWSIRLAIGDRVGKQLARVIETPIGHYRYRLSVWGKGILWDVGGFTPELGSVRVYLNETVRMSVTLQDTTWSEVNITDSFATAIGDSVTVVIHGGAMSETYFDLCRFQIAR
jgi:hypothetical protein